MRRGFHGGGVSFKRMALLRGVVVQGFLDLWFGPFFWLK